MNNNLGDNDIIILQSENGETLEFTEMAGIAYKGKFYSILKPNFSFDGMDDDKAMVFEAITMPGGSFKFEIVLDDNIVNAIFREYNLLLDDAIKNTYSY